LADRQTRHGSVVSTAQISTVSHHVAIGDDVIDSFDFAQGKTFHLVRMSILLARPHALRQPNTNQCGMRGCWTWNSLVAQLARSYPRHFTLITRTARCLRQLPSCVAVYPRDPRSRRVLCRWSHQLHCKEVTLQTSSKN